MTKNIQATTDGETYLTLQHGERSLSLLHGVWISQPALSRSGLFEKRQVGVENIRLHVLLPLLQTDRWCKPTAQRAAD